MNACENRKVCARNKVHVKVQEKSVIYFIFAKILYIMSDHITVTCFVERHINLTSENPQNMRIRLNTL